MIHANFRAYQLAVSTYRSCVQLRCPTHLRDQLLRASSSVVLNLSEASGRTSPADQRRFFSFALGSVREVQAILDLVLGAPADLVRTADSLGGHVYRLVHPSRDG